MLFIVRYTQNTLTFYWQNEELWNVKISDHIQQPLAFKRVSSDTVLLTKLPQESGEV